MLVVDSIRFGEFHYQSYADIPDVRSRRYMRELANDIQIRKYAAGYQARYSISADDFQRALDRLWTERVNSVTNRVEGTQVDLQSVQSKFSRLHWKWPHHAIQAQGIAVVPRTI